MNAAPRTLPGRPRRLRRDRRGQVRIGSLVARAVHTAALALFVGIIAHVAIVLLIPRFAPVDAWAKLSAVTNPWTFSEIAVPAGAEGRGVAVPLPDLDPLFGLVSCRFDLREGPASIVAEGNVPFWSVAVFDPRGQNIYSFNDRTAIAGRLDLVIVNDAQRARLRENPVEGLDRSVLVGANVDEGFVLVRALAPDESWVPGVQRFLNAATCERLMLPSSE